MDASHWDASNWNTSYRHAEMGPRPTGLRLVGTWSCRTLHCAECFGEGSRLKSLAFGHDRWTLMKKMMMYSKLQTTQADSSVGLLIDIEKLLQTYVKILVAIHFDKPLKTNRIEFLPSQSIRTSVPSRKFKNRRLRSVFKSWSWHPWTMHFSALLLRKH